MVATSPIRAARSRWTSARAARPYWLSPFFLLSSDTASSPLLSSRSAAERSASRLSPQNPQKQVNVTQQGFTLLELMIVMVVIGLLAAIAIPAYTSNIRNAKEATLKEDLHVLRQAIDSYTVDKQKAPQTLDDLVQAGYIKTMPVDPFTRRTDTWLPVQEDTLMSLDQTESGIDDVHSGSQLTAADGTSYGTW
ncbi:type II secretion system protein [Tunturiibacter lichenicola]|uniref:type II secretion system protein n=1 Tax=Tunturiibacter lichenicola TaxID=2051959 RepID=UPI003D9AEEB6